jgi:hypothetical protein
VIDISCDPDSHICLMAQRVFNDFVLGQFKTIHDQITDIDPVPRLMANFGETNA